MDNLAEKIRNLDDHKLIDVVKNYRQYGYSDETRNIAIAELDKRGVDLGSIILRGDFTNRSYDDAETYYRAFENLSKTAFFFYGLILIIKILMVFIAGGGALLTLVSIVFWISLFVYVIALIQSFIMQSRYFKTIGKEDNQLNPTLFFTVGMLLYIIMFFVFRKQMREDIKLIR